MNDAIDLFTKKTDVSIRENEAVFCFGMSKMTVPFENEDAKKYGFLYFSEFLEMIGRVADLNFKGSELESIGLHEKIEYILDDLFVIIPGAKRKSGNYEPEEATESDSDY